MEKIKLKPCPFCGKHVEIYTVGNILTKSRSAVIKCKYCNVTCEVAAIKFTTDWCRAKVIEKWNFRCVEVKLKDENERLKDLLEEVLLIYGNGFANLKQRYLVIRIKAIIEERK